MIHFSKNVVKYSEIAPVPQIFHITHYGSLLQSETRQEKSTTQSKSDLENVIPH